MNLHDENDLEPSNRLEARISEARLLEIANQLPGVAIGTTSLGRAQAAEALAKDRPESIVFSWFLDSYQEKLARDHAESLPNLSMICGADWPDRSLDLALVPIATQGEAELVRDILQTAYLRLNIGGWLVAAVDHADDHWLHDQMKAFDKHVKVRSFSDARVYLVQKEHELRRIRNFTCETSFRDRGRTIHLVTRPGVFAHRKFDDGAKQLLDAVDVFPESRILDLGCGSGAVAVALAARESDCQILAVDSNARAIWCSQAAAERNGVTNVRCVLDHSDAFVDSSSFDMVLGNPPYFGDHRIAEHFIRTALKALRPLGRLVLVTKQPNWYRDNIARWLDEPEVWPSGKYFIVSGLKPSCQSDGVRVN